jgi:cytochrome P450
LAFNESEDAHYL